MKGSCPALSFTLKGYSVTTTSATTFERGPCKDMKDGKEIMMTGEIQPGGSLRATRIEFKK